MKHKLIRVLGTIFTIALVTAMLTVSASAETKADVKYLDENGKEQTVTSATVVTEDMTEWNTGWYVVVNTVTIDDRVVVNGNVNLILENNASLHVSKGIDVSTGNTLTITGQLLGSEDRYGELMCNFYTEGIMGAAAIGGAPDEICGTIIINGGNISAQSSGGGAAIGGGYGCSAGTITINGGTIDAGAGEGGAAAIGGGYSGDGGNITITGGLIEANGGPDSSWNYAAGIGGGVNGAGGNITITGGKIDRVSSIGSGDNGGPCSIVMDGKNIPEAEDPLIVYADSINAPGETSTVKIMGRINFSVQPVSFTLTCGGQVTVDQATIHAGDRCELHGENVSILDSTVEARVFGNVIEVNNSVAVSLEGEKITVNEKNTVIQKQLTGADVTINDGVVEGELCVGDAGRSNGNLVINGGSINVLSLNYESTASVYNGVISTAYLMRSKLNLYGGEIRTVISTEGAFVYDYCGTALPNDFEPYDIFYLDCTDKDQVNGVVGGMVSLIEDLTIGENWEVAILPGGSISTSIYRLINNGIILVGGDFGWTYTGNSPYYAVNADTATVSAVSASGSIERDGVTYVQPDTLVTLQPKENSAVRWVTDPSYLTIQNNKFYMPDEVVSVKSSKLPLEDTPAIKVDGKNLTGFIAGTYYSISDAIFRPTGTTLPIRPEWYGTTVSIIKLGDGFATGDSFAQSLAIPAQSDGTGSGTGGSTGGNSGGGNDTGEQIVISGGDWEKAKDALSHADPGDTVVVKTDAGDTLPDDILAETAGRDVTLKIEVGTSFIWEIDGLNLPTVGKFQDISLKATLGTKEIPQAALDTLAGTPEVKQLTLEHDGAFGFTAKLHVNLGKENAGNWANLYYYNQQKQCMDYESSVRISTDGDAALLMSHASQYAVVIGGKSHALPFQDVKDSDWFQKAVTYTYRGDLMAGVSSTAFDPNAKLTRAQVVQVLYNLEGKPSVTGKTTFGDSVNHWAATPILWAEQTGVVGGYENGTFQPNKAVTREELSQMFYNYAKYKGYKLTASGDLCIFHDMYKIQDWAKTSMAWANGNGLINGLDNGMIDPSGHATRAQAASILMNFDLNVVKK